MKKIAIMQPYIFPYIGYFQVINAVDEYVIYDDVQYIKGGWINRNNLLSSNGKSLFTILLDNASANKKINEIYIKDDFTKFKKTISMTYSKAPYKDQIITLVDNICSYEDKNLARFIANSFVEISQYLNIQTKFIFSSDLKKDSNLRGQDKVISICKELGANIYVNAIGGQELYSKEDFNLNGVSLKFLQTGDIVYKQFSNDFVHWLSIIDVMMFNSPEKINTILGEYELI